MHSRVDKPVRLLKCDHEEADDRLMFHIVHVGKVDRYKKIIISAADTEIFVCSTYHFYRWVHLDLQKFWMLCGQGASNRALPIHEIVQTMALTVVDILPALHALTAIPTVKLAQRNQICLTNSRKWTF